MKPRHTGFTLVGVLVYAGTFVLIMITLLTFVAFVIRLHAERRLTGETLDNLRLALSAIAYDTRAAQGVYTPTSTFNVHPGQLSLATTQDLPADETLTYVDYYVDDEHIYVKRESQAAALLLSERIKVTNLVFTLLNEDDTPSIKIDITAALDSPDLTAVAKSSVSLSTTVSLRAYAKE